MEYYDTHVFDDNDEEIVELIDSNFFNRRVLRRPNIFNIMRDEDYIRRFRLTKGTTLHLLTQIEDQLEFDSNRNDSIAPINQLLCTLRFYATGSQLITCGDVIGVHESTACRIVHRVTHAIAQLRQVYIKFPRTPMEQQNVVADFYNVARFPRVLGAIDCTHVKIQSPGGETAEIYRNRKGYFSLNCQAICKADLQFSDVVARWHGSAHDANIWDNCAQKRNFVQKIYGDKLLLGDSGYSQTSYMMTPMAQPQSRAETLYQESQIRTRNVIERAFGVWKRRFPIISRGINVHLSRVPGIIIATAVLHNIALMQGDILPAEDPEYPVLFEENLPNFENTPTRGTTGQQDRLALIHMYFSRLR